MGNTATKRRVDWILITMNALAAMLYNRGTENSPEGRCELGDHDHGHVFYLEESQDLEDDCCEEKRKHRIAQNG